MDVKRTVGQIQHPAYAVNQRKPNGDEKIDQTDSCTADQNFSEDMKIHIDNAFNGFIHIPMDGI